MAHSLKKKTSKRENQLVVATVLLLIALGINIATVVSVLNRPVEAIVVHKADNATVWENHWQVNGRETLHARLWGVWQVSGK